MMDFNEKNLLSRYREAKDIEIERLLTQYGSSLKEVREMYPQLTGAIKRRQLTTALPTQPLFFTSTEAAEMGLGLQEGWMLKMSPTKTGEGYTSSLITPQEWEISEEGFYTSPTGERYTRADIEALLSEPVGGLETTPYPLAIENLTEEGQSLYGEYQEAGGELDVKGWVQLRERQQLETEEIFGRVFPEQDIAEIQAYMRENPEGFLTDIREIGPTEDMVALLKKIEFEDEEGNVRNLTEEEIRQFFAPGGVVIIEGPLSEAPIGSFRVTDQPIDKITEWARTDIQAVQQAMFWEGRSEKGAAIMRGWGWSEEDIDRVYHGTAPMRFVRGDWLPGPLEDYWKLYGVGVADLILGVAGLVDRMGADSFGNTLKNIGMQAQIVAVPVDYGKVNSPIWYAKNLMRMVPFILSIIDTALIAGGGAISVARTAGGGPLLCRIVGTITGGATSAVGEGVIEAGHAYHEAEARGYTQEEMNAVFDKVLLGNIGLLSVTNTAQFGAAFMLPGGATARFLTKALIFGFEAASEGVEEGAQLFITRGALGDKVAVFDDEFWQNFNLGLVGGLTFGGAGSVYSAIQNRIETKMTDKQKMKIEEDITEGMMQGISEQEAQGKALDKFAETPEGEAIITETVQEIMEEEQAKAKEIGEVQKVVDAIKPVSDQVQPISERAQGLVDETLAETALNQIQSTNPNLTVPVGGEVGLGVKDANVVLPQTGVTEAELTIPGSQEIIDGLLIPNWIRTKLKGAARVPVFRKIHEAVLGWRSLIDKQSQATEDIVGRAAVVYGAIMRTGTNISRIELNTLKDIVPNPVRYFGFNDVGYSGKMAARLLPAYKSERAISGTLEHVFTHPEMYNWAKMDKGLRYVARVNQIYDAIRKLLQKEGVVLDAVNERWIHRVVTGRMIEGKVVEVRGRPGRAGVQPGAVPAYKKPRAFETMAEGIQALIRYEPNIEVPVSSYIEEAYKEIAGERFTKLIEEFGVTPSERLLERFPEIAERAELTKEELADAAKLHSVISRAKRGEKLPEQTLRAMERRFPGLGRRLRALIGEKSSEVQGLRNALAQMQDFVKSLQAKTEEAIKAAKEQPTIEIPTDQKIRQAFKVMEYEDRLAFRNTMDTQLEEIGGMVANQEGEIEALDETLKTDPVATFIVHVGKIKRHLDYFLKHGEWPESFTLKEAAALTMKPVEQVQARTKEGRVPSAYVIDELADHFNLTEGELITRIEGVADSRERLADLRVLVDAANQREEGINRMLNILAEVEGKPENVSPEEPRIPTAEAGMPEAGLQTDIFGYQTPVQPRGKGEIRQMGIDDYQKLAKMREEAGMPPPNVNIKPKVEGISELAGDTEIQQATFPVPDEKTVQERKEAFNELASEAKALVEARKAPYWRARAERAAKMEIVRQPGIGEGYIPMPFAGGKMYNQDFIDACNKFFGVEKGNPVLKVTSDAAGILRMTKAALDFSAMSIQGMPSFGMAHLYLLRNPRIGVKLMGAWYKALGESTAAFFNPGVFYGYMAKNEATANQRISFGGSSMAIDYFEALKAKHGLGRIAAWVFRKMPFKPYQRAEIAFYSAGEIVRNEFWKALSPKAIKDGKAFELANQLDLMTGIAQATATGVPLTIRQLESSFMWFAPNYTRACLSLLGNVFRGGYTGAMAKQALGGMLGAVVVYYMGIQMAIALLSGKDEDDAWNEVKEGLGIREDPITHEVTWQPRSDFLSIKIGNYTFGLGSFWYGLVRLVGNICGVINEVGDKERIDLIKIMEHGAPNRDNPFVYWWYCRASPLTGLGFELSTHKDFLSYPIETIGEYAQYILTRFEPIWMEQGINWLIPGLARDYEIPEDEARAALIPFELFGWRSVPESAWVRFYDKAEEYTPQIPRDELDDKQIEAWEEGKLGWGQLTKKQKQDLLDRYPELVELYEDAQNDSKIRQTPEWEAYTNRIDEERGIYHDRVDELTARLQNGEIDTRIYRELASDAGANYGSIIESISRDPNYAEIFEYFDKKQAEGSKYEFAFDLALAEYDTQIRFADDPGIYLPNGDYNWDERDRRITTFIEKHGEELYHSILDYISKEKEEKGLNPVWVKRGQDTEKLSREYWNLPYKPIAEMTEEDYNEGNIPTEYYGLWRTYQGLPDADKEGFVELHSELAKDWRAEYRRNNPEADAMLALWGYGGKLQSMEAYNLVVQWGKELDIPLESMGLGLPPYNLIENYFNYNQLATQFSGNSAEAKLWRLEHTDFTDWAMENWDWEGTEEYKGIEYYQLQVKWRDMEAEYGVIEGEKARAEFLNAHPDFRDDRRRLQALDNEIPEDLIPDYIEYYQVERKDYEDDWFLLDHEDFYNMMVDMGFWQPRDFSKVPSREVWNLYQTYLGLPTGTPRYDFRAKHLDLDAWLVLKFGYKPIQDRGD